MQARPVAIGGIGGSGTRVVAQILAAGGVYIGEDINASQDNLWFTLLMKRPRRYPSGDLRRPLSLFYHAMEGRGASDPVSLAQATYECFRFGNDYAGKGRGKWALNRMWSILRAAPHGRWGWKEPNTHLHIALLSEHPTLRYVHVIRHGLDMAFSKNRSQLRTWGRHFGIAPSDDPSAALDYWLAANRRAISLGASLMPERFYVCRMDDLIDAPDVEGRRLAEFMEIPWTEQMAALPQRPPSSARWKRHHLGQFSAESLRQVEDLGFAV